MLNSELQPGFKDMICIDTTIHLSRWDAFKALLGYPVYSQTRVSTENVIGKTETQNEVSVPRIFWRLRSKLAVGEEEVSS